MSVLWWAVWYEALSHKWCGNETLYLEQNPISSSFCDEEKIKWMKIVPPGLCFMNSKLRNILSPI